MTRTQRRLATLLWLSLVCAVALFHGLFTLAPVDKTEALQMGIAETMLRLGEWVVPQWNGHLYADKPPLPYWLAMGLWSRFSLHPELARVPAAITATVGVASLVWVLHHVASRQGLNQANPFRAVLGGTLLALSPGWIAFAHTAEHDIYLAVAICLALLGYAVGFATQDAPSRSWPWSLWIGFWCGVGFLSKGLLGIGLPLLIITTDALLRPATRQRLFTPPQLLLFGLALLAVVSPWISSLVAHQHWDYLQGFLGFSNLERATKAVDGHDQPLFFYGPVLIGLLVPWWPLLLSALGQLWRQRRGWAQAEGIERLQQLAAVWLLLSLLLFTLIPTKLPGYILPVLPAASLLMATAPRHPNWSLRLVAGQLGLLNLAVIGLILSARLGSPGQDGQALVSLPGGAMVVGGCSVLALVGAIWAWREPSRGRRLAALTVSMLLLVFCLPTLATPYRTLQQEPVRHLARTAQTEKGAAQVLYVMGKPRYSVVALADMPTIFGSPRKTVAERPVSSYRNWLEHRNDREALVLGPCRQITALAEEQGPEIRMLERQGNECLARLQRRVSGDQR